jgi:hypothetical protein
MPLSSSRSWDVVSVSASDADRTCSKPLTKPVYVFIGTLLLSKAVLMNIAGGIVGITGIAYIVLEFVPAIEPPSNMREAEVAGWGAEQV